MCIRINSKTRLKSSKWPTVIVEEHSSYGVDSTERTSAQQIMPIVFGVNKTHLNHGFLKLLSAGQLIETREQIHHMRSVEPDSN